MQAAEPHARVPSWPLPLPTCGILGSLLNLYVSCFLVLRRIHDITQKWNLIFFIKIQMNLFYNTETDFHNLKGNGMGRDK